MQTVTNMKKYQQNSELWRGKQGPIPESITSFSGLLDPILSTILLRSDHDAPPPPPPPPPPRSSSSLLRGSVLDISSQQLVGLSAISP